MDTPSERDQLIIRLISAVAANITPNQDGTLNLNATVASEMVDQILVEFEVLKIRKPH